MVKQTGPKFRLAWIPVRLAKAYSQSSDSRSLGEDRIVESGFE
jgi:hypothetical protein